MTRIKICGITDPEGAAAAAEAGADALGFNFVTGTPRCVAPEIAGAIIAGLPPFVTAVGVFLDQPLETVLRAAAVAGVEAAPGAPSTGTWPGRPGGTGESSWPGGSGPRTWVRPCAACGPSPWTWPRAWRAARASRTPGK